VFLYLNDFVNFPNHDITGIYVQVHSYRTTIELVTGIGLGLANSKVT